MIATDGTSAETPVRANGVNFHGAPKSAGPALGKGGDFHGLLTARLAIARQRRDRWLDELEQLADWLDEIREYPTEREVRAWLMTANAFVARMERKYR